MSQKPGLALKIFIQANYRGLGHAVCFDLPTTGGDRSLEQTAASHLGLQLAVHDTSGFPDVLLYVLTVFRIPYVEFKRVLDGSGWFWIFMVWFGKVCLCPDNTSQTFSTSRV